MSVSDWPAAELDEATIAAVTAVTWRNLSREQIMAVAAAWNADMDTPRMAADLGTPAGSLGRLIGVLRRHGADLGLAKECLNPLPPSNVEGFWTPEREALCRKLYITEGWSAQEVARKIGAVSRSAVIGLAHRRGWAKDRPPQVAAGNSRANTPRAPKVKPQPRTRPPKPGPQGKPAVVFGRTGKRAEAVARAETLTATADIFALNEATCRFPIGDPRDKGFGYCGRPRERGAYCACHGARAYDGLPVKERRRDPAEDLIRAARRWAA